MINRNGSATAALHHLFHQWTHVFATPTLLLIIIKIIDVLRFALQPLNDMGEFDAAFVSPPLVYHLDSVTWEKSAKQVLAGSQKRSLLNIIIAQIIVAHPRMSS